MVLVNGNLLVRPLGGGGGGGGHVFRIEMSKPLVPHSDERPRCQLIHRFPRVFDGRKGIPPDRAFAPFFSPFSLPSLVAHMDFQAMRSGWLMCSAAPSQPC